MIRKGKEILNGVKNTIVKNEEVEELAKKRLEICNNCNRNSKSIVPYCLECGCVLKTKVRSVNSKCPIGKW